MTDTTDLKQELAAAAESVQRYLEQDDFPEQVSPEELRMAVKAYPLQGGKRLRPALVLWSCAMFGGDMKQALPAAAAVEIYHNWTLVHDDIIDRDEFRRGAPAAHVLLRDYAAEHFPAKKELSAKFGADFAILQGDIQQGWAIDAMLRLQDNGVSPKVVQAIVRRMQTFLNRRLISGEAADVEFPLRNPEDVSEQQIMDMISGKTSALLQFCVQCGAAIALENGNFESDIQKRLAQFTDYLGQAFQLQDDLLGLFGDEKTFGKPIGSDFQEAKPTVLYRRMFDMTDDGGRKLLQSKLGLPSYSEQDIAVLRKLAADSGAEASVRKTAEELSRKAVAALDSFPANRYRDLLKALTEHLLCRMI